MQPVSGCWKMHGACSIIEKLCWWLSSYSCVLSGDEDFSFLRVRSVARCRCSVEGNYNWNVGKEVEARELVDFSRGIRFLQQKKISS
jgi:hypothetical protein